MKYMGIGDWGLGIGDWGLGPIPKSFFIYFIIIKKLNNFLSAKFMVLYGKFLYSNNNTHTVKILYSSYPCLFPSQSTHWTTWH